MQYLFGILMFITSLFLILLILVQRGRGGGLAGAFGGMGGQSAFGTKAGDLFTRITIVVAAVWILLSVGAIKVLNRSQSLFGDSAGSGSVFSGGVTGSDKSSPAGKTEDLGTATSAQDSELKTGAAPASGAGALPTGNAEAVPGPAGTTAESAPSSAPPPAAVPNEKK